MTLTRSREFSLRNRPNPVALLAAAACVLLLPATLSASDTAARWFHVRVHDGDTGAEVEINLPLRLVETVLDNLPDSLDGEVRLELDDADFEVEELRRMWSEIRNGEEATYVTVKDEDETVEVRKSGKYLLAETTERGPLGAKVNVRVPLPVIDALFSGDPDRLDLAAAVRVLAESGEREIVTVQDQDTTVRVWVDDSSDSTE